MGLGIFILPAPGSILLFNAHPSPFPRGSILLFTLLAWLSSPPSPSPFSCGYSLLLPLPPGSLFSLLALPSGLLLPARLAHILFSLLTSLAGSSQIPGSGSAGLFYSTFSPGFSLLERERVDSSFSPGFSLLERVDSSFSPGSILARGLLKFLARAVFLFLFTLTLLAWPGIIIFSSPFGLSLPLTPLAWPGILLFSLHPSLLAGYYYFLS